MAKNARTARTERAPARNTIPAKTARPDPARLSVVHYPASVLKRQAEDVADINPWLRAVAARMMELMAENKGVGLAAPQVGISLRMFIISPEGTAEGARVVINPVITDAAGEVDGEEGCLSLPDIRVDVARHEVVTMESYDLDGTPKREQIRDWPARIVQHETDHLDGILIVDRISPAARLGVRQKLRGLEAKG